MNLRQLIKERKKVICTELSPKIETGHVETISSLVDIATVTSLKKTAKEVLERDSEKESVDKCAEVKKDYGIETIPTITCRDHEMNTDFLASINKLGIHNLLLLYGDPNEPPHPSKYFFKDSVQLLKWLREEESGSFGDRTFSLCVAGNPANASMEKEIESITRKFEAGADMIVTQPVFDVSQCLAYADALESRGIRMPVLYGLLLFKSEKSPQFIEKTFGIRIPQEVKDLVNEKGADSSMDMAEEICKNVKNASGFQVYPYAGLEKTAELLKRLKEYIG